MAEKWRVPSLPEDVIIDILERVESVKSLGRFRCVSKSWRSFLSTPRFAKSQLQINIIHGPRSVFSIYGSDIHVSNFAGGNHKVTHKRANIEPFEPESGFWAEASCHGLVLLRDSHGLVLVNPITLEAEPIPHCGKEVDGYALGYHDDDYNVVTVGKHVVDIYSVRNKTWRSVPNSSPYQFSSATSSAFVGGRLNILSGHCEQHAPRRLIWAFNLASEEFETVPLPTYRYEIRYNHIADIGGCLGMMIYSYSGHSNDFWVMKEYGVLDSWTKFTIDVSHPSVPMPVCFLGEDVVVLLVVQQLKPNSFVAYNLRSGDCKDMIVDGTPDLRQYGNLSFRESLISPRLPPKKLNEYASLYE